MPGAAGLSHSMCMTMPLLLSVQQQPLGPHQRGHAVTANASDHVCLTLGRLHVSSAGRAAYRYILLYCTACAADCVLQLRFSAV